MGPVSSLMRCPGNPGPFRLHHDNELIQPRGRTINVHSTLPSKCELFLILFLNKMEEEALVLLMATHHVSEAMFLCSSKDIISGWYYSPC